LFSLAGADLLLGLVRHNAPRPSPAAVKRLLIALGGHLGDAVLLTAILQYLHAEHPGIEIGVALPSWARTVIEQDPRVSWIHPVDHWKDDRSPASTWTKWRRYRKSYRTAIEAIRSVRYGAAIDLRTHYPNMATLLQRAGIPVRAGFTSAGFGRLYTHPMGWRDDHTHVVMRHIELLGELLGSNRPSMPPRCELPSGDPRTTAEIGTLLTAHDLDRKGYLLVHMGSGDQERVWTASGWRAVCEKLSARGHRMVFTGRGEAEASMIAAVADATAGAVNLCDQLEWPEFVEVVRSARCVLSVETSAAHVAAATNTPCVSVWLGRDTAPYWRPLGERIRLLVPAPRGVACECAAGCAEIVWVPAVSAEMVLRAVDEVMPTGRRDLTGTTPAGAGAR
jgi:heptosyltransferase-2